MVAGGDPSEWGNAPTHARWWSRMAGRPGSRVAGNRLR
jgi:hypothetical protein